MPFITFNINPDLKQTNRMLGRIAHVLECMAKEHFGLTLKDPGVPDEKDMTFVSYTSDLEERRKELEKEMGKEPEPLHPAESAIPDV
jgi:hypothetical protein